MKISHQWHNSICIYFSICLSVHSYVFSPLSLWLFGRHSYIHEHTCGALSSPHVPLSLFPPSISGNVHRLQPKKQGGVDKTRQDGKREKSQNEDMEDVRHNTTLQMHDSLLSTTHSDSFHHTTMMLILHRSYVNAQV